MAVDYHAAWFLQYPGNHPACIPPAPPAAHHGDMAKKQKKVREKDPAIVAIGLRIRAARDAVGLSQREVAEAVPDWVNDRTIGNWERGERAPDSRDLLLLCRILSVTPNDLLSQEGVDVKEIKMLQIYRKLQAEAQDKVRRFVDFESHDMNGKPSHGRR